MACFIFNSHPKLWWELLYSPGLHLKLRVSMYHAVATRILHRLSSNLAYICSFLARFDWACCKPDRNTPSCRNLRKTEILVLRRVQHGLYWAMLERNYSKVVIRWKLIFQAIQRTHWWVISPSWTWNMLLWSLPHTERARFFGSTMSRSHHDYFSKLRSLHNCSDYAWWGWEFPLGSFPNLRTHVTVIRSGLQQAQSKHEHKLHKYAKFELNRWRIRVATAPDTENS